MPYQPVVLRFLVLIAEETPSQCAALKVRGIIDQIAFESEISKWRIARVRMSETFQTCQIQRDPLLREQRWEISNREHAPSGTVSTFSVTLRQPLQPMGEVVKLAPAEPGHHKTRCRSGDSCNSGGTCQEYGSTVWLEARVDRITGLIFNEGPDRVGRARPCR